MGISHTLGILGANGNVDRKVYLHEKSFANRSLARFLINLPLEFISLEKLRDYPPNFFDFSIISTPPFDRGCEIELVSNVSKKVLVEKPIKVKTLPLNCFSGYTLQYSPMFEVTRKYLERVNIKKITITLKTPEDLGSSKTWRKGKDGGIINEFGGHCFTLLALCDETSSLDVESHRIESNHAHINGRVGVKNTPFVINMYAACQEVRKTSYLIEFVTDQGDMITYDNYALNINGILAENAITIGTSVDYYLRGFEYSNELSFIMKNKEEPISRKFVTDFESIMESILCD